MSRPGAFPPFATFPVGSLPRPRWLRDVIEERKRGGIGDDAFDALLDAAVPSAITMQERAGLDVVSDGEWRRESYVKVFSEHVGGFGGTEMPVLVAGASPDPAVVSRLEPRGHLAREAALFLRAHTSRRTIVALPSPYLIGWRMWRADVSSTAYATREEFMEACVPIIRAEVSALASAGIDHVQIDEPWLLMLVDPDHRERLGVDDLESEIERCVRLVNSVLTPTPTVATSLHLCHGHFNRKRATDGGYEPIIEALAELRVDRIAMEFAAPESHGLDALTRFPEDKVLGLGVIDHCDPQVEASETVLARAEAALAYVPPERLTLNPDCGFAPGAQNPMDFDEAYAKLCALAHGAELLRDRYA